MLAVLRLKPRRHRHGVWYRSGCLMLVKPSGGEMSVELQYPPGRPQRTTADRIAHG
jgi:hypothetical protein